MLRILAITVGLLLASSAQAERIENFVLLDQHGAAHNLHYHRDKSAVVIMIQGNGCPIVRNALTDYKALRDSFADQGVHFMMLNANLQDQRSTILAEAEKFGIDMPILHDETQLIGESLNLVRTAEVLVIDPKIGRSFTAGRSTTGRSMSVKRPKPPTTMQRTQSPMCSPTSPSLSRAATPWAA
jgi:hypothetical protein